MNVVCSSWIARMWDLFACLVCFFVYFRKNPIIQIEPQQTYYAKFAEPSKLNIKKGNDWVLNVKKCVACVGFIGLKNQNFHSFSPPPCSTTLQWAHGVPIRPRFDDSPSKISRRWRIPTRRHAAMQFNQVQNAAGSSTLLSQKKKGKNILNSFMKSIDLGPGWLGKCSFVRENFHEWMEPKIDTGTASVCYDLFKLCDTTDAARDVTAFVGSLRRKGGSGGPRTHCTEGCGSQQAEIDPRLTWNRQVCV